MVKVSCPPTSEYHFDYDYDYDYEMAKEVTCQSVEFVTDTELLPKFLPQDQAEKEAVPNAADNPSDLYRQWKQACMGESIQVMYNEVPARNPSWFLYALRVLACILLAVAFYCFCNGYQEVKFLEIVNKCLEGHHNPMCEGFMEPDATMNNYKPITVQEDMYADRLEWIPKKMDPSQEYSTLLSILERHPCQSLRCLDKLTAQIYGGSQGGMVEGPWGAESGTNMLPQEWENKPELKDRFDDVLKGMGHYDETMMGLKEVVIKKNNEYLLMDDHVEIPFTQTQDVNFNKMTQQHYFKIEREKAAYLGISNRIGREPRQLQERDLEKHIQRMIPDHLDIENDILRHIMARHSARYNSIYNSGQTDTVLPINHDLKDKLSKLINETSPETGFSNNKIIETESEVTQPLIREGEIGTKKKPDTNTKQHLKIDNTNRKEKLLRTYDTNTKQHTSPNADHKSVTSVDSLLAGGNGVPMSSFNVGETVVEAGIAGVEGYTVQGAGRTGAAATGEAAARAAAAMQLCSEVITANMFDCHPEGGASEKACVARGCCWTSDTVAKSSTATPDPTIHTNTRRHNGKASRYRVSRPFCFYPSSYRSHTVIHQQETPFGQEALLQLIRSSGHAGDQPEMRLQIVYLTDDVLKIEFTPSSGPAPWRPVLPAMHVNGGGAAFGGGGASAATRRYHVYLDHRTAALTVTRTGTNTTIFSTRGAAPLVFAQQFVQVSSLLPSTHIYGLGQHLDGLLLDTDWSRYLMWNADQPNTPGLNLYGSHPFYMVMEGNGVSHAVFLHNTNAMSVTLQPAPAVTFHTTGGGGATLYIMTGPDPAAVLDQYTALVGRPTMPPYWALGYHQCRFGYGSLNRTKEVWQRTRDAGIPFDTQWNDLDYMADRNDFSYDHDAFAGLPAFVDQLHEVGMHYVPLVDPGISGEEPPGTYLPLDEGIKMNIFVRNTSGQPFVGKVWNKVSTVWPDFSHPRALYYWARQLVRFHATIHYDGAWIDMNEPSNFYSGTVHGCNTSDPLNSPPFIPAGLVGGSLNHKTLCSDAQHYLGPHYRLHNLYGNMEAVATNVALKVVRGERPLVISRASFPGLGAWAGHWTGDVTSDWENLRASVADVLNMNLFGIPLVGADICGFNGNTTVELCLRWMQLGAFYPFSRNHNTDDAVDQDPVAMGPAVITASKQALTERYRLLPYLYTLFHDAYTSGATVARPMFVQFPTDAETYGISSQFLWGDGLMIVPALDPNVTTVEAYLPCDSEWYDWYTGEKVGGDYGSNIIGAGPNGYEDRYYTRKTKDNMYEGERQANEQVYEGESIENTNNEGTYADEGFIGKEIRSKDDSNRGEEDNSEQRLYGHTNYLRGMKLEDNQAYDISVSDEDSNSISDEHYPGALINPSQEVKEASLIKSKDIEGYFNTAALKAAGVDLQGSQYNPDAKMKTISGDAAAAERRQGCHYVTLPAPLDKVTLLVRGGAILPTQRAGVTTTISRQSPHSLHVALDSSGTANGRLYVDDGVTIISESQQSFTSLVLRAAERRLLITADVTGYRGDIILEGVRVLGVVGPVELVTVNDEPLRFAYNPRTQVLTVDDLHLNLPLYFVMRW